MAIPFCTDCQRPMEGGFLLDSTDSGKTAAQWIEGPPEQSVWGGLKVRGRRRLPVYAWRCPGCAVVRLYAPEG